MIREFINLWLEAARARGERRCHAGHGGACPQHLRRAAVTRVTESRVTGDVSHDTWHAAAGQLGNIWEALSSRAAVPRPHPARGCGSDWPRDNTRMLDIKFDPVLASHSPSPSPSQQAGAYFVVSNLVTHRPQITAPLIIGYLLLGLAAALPPRPDRG